MKKKIAYFAAIIFGALGSVYADNQIALEGTWPKSWPAELEPLRKQSRTIMDDIPNDRTAYEIPFTSQEDFESAWPYLLEIKSKGAPLVLLRGPDEELGARINAGVRIQCPPPQPENGITPPAPIPGTTNVRERWLWTTYVELVVDGEIVDLNRIPLPPDTPIIDERFKDGQHKSLN